MAEFMLGSEMIDQAKREGRYHEGGRIGNYGLSHEDVLQRLLEVKMRRNGWRPGWRYLKS